MILRVLNLIREGTMKLEGEALRLSQRPVTFWRLTGLKVERFCAVLVAVEPLYPTAEITRLKTRERQRDIGVGKHIGCRCAIVC